MHSSAGACRAPLQIVTSQLAIGRLSSLCFVAREHMDRQELERSRGKRPKFSRLWFPTPLLQPGLPEGQWARALAAPDQLDPTFSHDSLVLDKAFEEPWPTKGQQISGHSLPWRPPRHARQRRPAGRDGRARLALSITHPAPGGSKQGPDAKQWGRMRISGRRSMPASQGCCGGRRRSTLGGGAAGGWEHFCAPVPLYHARGMPEERRCKNGPI